MAAHESEPTAQTTQVDVPDPAGTGTETANGTSVTQSATGFRVEETRTTTRELVWAAGVLDVANAALAEPFLKTPPPRRVLVVTDDVVHGLYGDAVARYLEHFGMTWVVHRVDADKKTMAAACLDLCDVLRGTDGPMLVLGGNSVGTTAQLAGLLARGRAPSTAKTVRLPTTLRGMVAAASPLEAPTHTLFDLSLLATLPETAVRDGLADLAAEAAFANGHVFDLLDSYCEELARTRFGGGEGAKPEVKGVADQMLRESISTMLHAGARDGMSWPLTHDLESTPRLRHGHVVSINVAYRATLGYHRGLLSNAEHHRVLNLLSRAGLSIDHACLDEKMLDKYSSFGKKLAMPGPLGTCTMLEDVSPDHLRAVLRRHKLLSRQFARKGDGLDACMPPPPTASAERPRPTDRIVLPPTVYKPPTQLERSKSMRHLRPNKSEPGIMPALVQSGSLRGKTSMTSGSPQTDPKDRVRESSSVRKAVPPPMRRAASQPPGRGRSASTSRQVAGPPQRAPSAPRLPIRAARGIGHCLTSGLGNGHARGHRPGVPKMAGPVEGNFV